MANLTPESVIKLNSGYTMPVIGLGLFETPPDITESLCTEALNAGYRHIDSADWYDNEAGCGAAIRAALASGALTREQVFFTSKVPMTKMSHGAARALVDETLAKTGLAYIDLFLIHTPFGGPEARKAVWRALVEAVDAGKVRSIGVSNYGLHHLAELEAYIAELAAERGNGNGNGKGAGVGGGVLSVGQWELHPWLARADIAEWCRRRGVAVQAYCPLVRGKRWGEPALRALAGKYGVSEAQVLLRWSMQKGFVPLPKSVNPERIRANIDVFAFVLTEEEVAQLETDEYSSVLWDPTVEPLEK